MQRHGVAGQKCRMIFDAGNPKMQDNEKIPSWNESYSHKPLLHIFFRVARNRTIAFFQFSGDKHPKFWMLMKKTEAMHILGGRPFIPRTFDPKI